MIDEELVEGAAALGHEDGPPRRSGMRRGWRIAIGAAAALVFVFAAGAFWLVRQIDPPGGPGEPVAVEIAEGTSASKIAAILDEKGVITSARIFRLYARVTGAGEFQAGIYRRGELRERMSMGEVVDALEAGPEIEYFKLTIPEGLWLADIARRVGEMPGRSEEQFIEAANSGIVRSKYQPEGSTSLEGLLFPDTYYVTEDETEEEILRRMVALFDQVADEMRLADKAAVLGRSPYEVVTIASLIEEETKLPEELPLVASVIHNRLEKGMLLEIDATIDYAYGEHLDRKLNRHLEIESPYNTYRNPGLPPTPIAAPGEESLRAALSPADTKYLYYVKVDEDGRQAFAETFEGHQANIAEAKRRGVR